MSTAAASTMLAAALACPLGPGPSVVVVAEHHAPAVGATYRLDEISGFASRAGHIGRHPVLGFYLATFGYTLEPAGSGPCPGSAMVRLILGGRQVEVPSDAEGWGCRPDALVARYLSHAKADDAELSRLARRLQGALDQALQPGGKPVQTEALGAIVEGLRPAYDADRAQALAASDPEPELDRLRGACRGGAPGSL